MSGQAAHDKKCVVHKHHTFFFLSFRGNGGCRWVQRRRHDLAQPLFRLRVLLLAVAMALIRAVDNTPVGVMLKIGTTRVHAPHAGIKSNKRVRVLLPYLVKYRAKFVPGNPLRLLLCGKPLKIGKLFICCQPRRSMLDHHDRYGSNDCQEKAPDQTRFPSAHYILLPYYFGF